MSKTYTFTINVEAPFTPYTDAKTGKTSKSVAGHVWFNISDGTAKGTINSGLASAAGGKPLDKGAIKDDDNTAYAGDPYLF